MAATFQVGSTPNPNSIRVGLSESKYPKATTYKSGAEAQADPLAKALFAIPGITQVFMLNNFVSINKDTAADWATIEPRVAQAFMDHLNG